MSFLPRVIIADDEPSFRTLTAHVLGAQHYDLVLAADGREALAAARALAPDLMLLDVNMPGMGGVEACQELRADPRLAEVPVVLLTGLNDREARLRGFGAGADDFLGKPFDQDELRMRVRVITRLNRFRRLQEQRQRTERVISLSDDGFLLIRRDGTVAQANAAAWRLLGGMPEQGGAALDFRALAQRRHRCEPPEAWAGGFWEKEAKPRLLVGVDTVTGAPRWLLLETLEPHAVAERWFRLRDVSREHALQRDLWTFHGAVSHKLLTPLNGLTGSLELLACELEGANQEARECAEMARDSAARLEDSIKSILGFLAAGRNSAPPAAWPASELAALIEVAAARVGVARCHVSLAGLEGANIAMPQPALALCLEALFDNARKFHPIQKPAVEVEVGPDDASISLIVRDDGTHLPDEALARAWEPYYQWEKSFSGEIPGMGLGLAMVSALVVEAGGGCLLRNRLNRPGIEAELRLPSVGTAPAAVSVAPGRDFQKEL